MDQLWQMGPEIDHRIGCGLERGVQLTETIEAKQQSGELVFPGEHTGLRNKRAELAGALRDVEQQLVHQQAELVHLDATMRLFDPNIRPKEIHPSSRGDVPLGSV